MASPGADGVHYLVDLSRPGHEVEVTLTVVARSGDELSFSLPVWAPGSYLVREFPRHVNWFRASQGAALPVRKADKDQWIVFGVQEGPLQVRYGLHAHELTVRTNYLGPDRALLCGAATFMLPEGREAGPFRVEVVQPAGWPPPHCPLPARAGGWDAPSYDALLDAPIAAGPCRVADFEVRGTPHRIALYGEGDCDVGMLAQEARVACEAAAAVFGDIPSPSYLFVVEHGCTGGLEHADSSVCGFPVLGCSTPADRRRRLALLVHEYFHLWNVKRIRPAALGPFDYRGEVLTPHLWVVEGLTSYYQHLLPLRAGLVRPERFLTILASYLLDLELTPGRYLQSLEESSCDAWIKFYRPDENTRNSQVSYYGKGLVAGLVLDLEIRRRTSGARSLDDAFRSLYRLWRERPERGYDDAELRSALDAAAGGSLADVIEECVLRRGEIDVDGRLASVGLRLERRPPERGGGWLGASLKDRGGRLVVDTVVREGPAWSAGLSPGEELIAVDGFRVGRQDVVAWLDERRPGTAAVVTTSLWGRLRQVPVQLGQRPSRDYRIRKLPEAGEAARRTCESWLGIPWERLTPLDEKPEEQRAAEPSIEA